MDISTLKQHLSLPIITSPMFLVSGVDLVVACCKNGILGTFPSLNGRTADDFEKMLQEITGQLQKFEEETGKKAAPFGVNIIVNRTNPRVMSDLQLCVKYKVPLVITSLGAVKEVVDAVHSYGGLVFHDVIKKRHAEKAAEAGVDGIIAVCAGAGGHAGTASPFALLQEIRSFYSGALILAGSISKGSDVLAAQIMGADFAYMGTHFIATKESMASAPYKETMLTSGIDDVIYTAAVSGVNANFLKKSVEAAGIDPARETKEDFSQLAGEHAKAWKDIWSVGHGVITVREVLSTAEVIGNIKNEYRVALQKQQQLVEEFSKKN